MDNLLDKKFSEIEEKFLTGKIKEALQDMESIDQNEESSFEDRTICDILRTKLYFFYQPFSQAIKFGEEALKGSMDIGNELLIFDAAFHYGRALCLMGIIDVGAAKLKLAEETLNKFHDKESSEFLRREVWLLGHSKGWRDGFDFLFERLTQALSIAESLDDEYLQVNIYYELASLYQWYGDHRNFKKYLNICLELAERFGYQEYIMWSLIGLGTVDLYKGDLDKAFDFFMASLPIANKLESSYALSFILGDIGLIYWHKQDEDSALNFYNKCIKGLQNSDNTKHRQYPWILFRSILVLLEQGRYDEAKEQQEIITSISELQSYRSQHLSHKLARLSEAIMLKKISPIDHFHEVTKLLETVAYDSLIHDELNKTALYHLCDSYFRQLLSSNDLRFLVKINEKVRDLENMARKQESSVILAEALLFESQISLLNLDITEAKLLLNDAQRIAEEKEIHRLANLISNAYDNVLDNLDQWETASSLLPDISDRMEITHIEELLHKLIRNKIIYSSIVKEEEQPSAFIILNEENSLLFFEVLNDISLDVEVLDGILPEIQNVVNKYDCVNPVFERVRYKGYTIIVDKYRTLTFCYIFIGKSYSACVKFQKLVKEVQSSSNIWKNLLPKLENGHKLTTEDCNQLTAYLHNIYKNEKRICED
ncbi:MAG: tetratricopeptide repeat protein [Candidatus Heimdallarchaeota archaeon]|nr:tetratricopeptide repeat protein [Candidatus Heimdallarchaeota archaeon]